MNGEDEGYALRNLDLVINVFNSQVEALDVRISELMNIRESIKQRISQLLSDSVRK